MQCLKRKLKQKWNIKYLYSIKKIFRVEKLKNQVTQDEKKQIKTFMKLLKGLKKIMILKKFYLRKSKYHQKISSTLKWLDSTKKTHAGMLREFRRMRGLRNIGA